MALLGVFGGLVGLTAWRRRGRSEVTRVAQGVPSSGKGYARPAIVYEAVLEVQAGSTLDSPALDALAWATGIATAC